MAEFLFFKQSAPQMIVGNKEMQNVCVVGLDGKGWTSELLLASVSPWIKELMSSLPPNLDHCVILPDITWKDISGFFQGHALLNSLRYTHPSWEVSGDLGNLLKIPHGGEILKKPIANYEDLDEKMLSIQKLIQNVRKSKQSKQNGPDNYLKDCKEEEHLKNELFNNYIKKEGSLVTKAPSSTGTPNKMTKHKKGPIKCEQCGKVLNRIYNLKRHLENSCNKEGKRVPYRPRKRKLKYSARQIRRIMTYSNVDSYNLDAMEGITFSPCDKCDKKCISPDALKRHQEIRHPIIYPCNYCQYSARGLRKLKFHIRSDHGELPESCDLCDKKYNNPKGLLLHKRIVHEGIRFPCGKCDYKATSTTTLRLHINSIHEKITVTCDVCDKVYTHPRNLRQHQISVHKGIFYLCDQCDYKGTQKRNLQRHIEKVHEGISYSCNQCDYKSTQKRKFECHIEKCLTLEKSTIQN